MLFPHVYLLLLLRVTHPYLGYIMSLYQVSPKFILCDVNRKHEIKYRETCLYHRTCWGINVPYHSKRGISGGCSSQIYLDQVTFKRTPQH